MPITNDFSNLYPEIYAAFDEVSREQVGFAPAVNLNTSLESVALGQSVRYHVSTPTTTQARTTAMTPPEPPGRTESSGFMAITEDEFAPFGMTGDDELRLESGVGLNTVVASNIAEAIRALTNKIENQVAAAAVAGASRAFGTAGTTPFATSIEEMTQLRKILVDNGSPQGNLQLVLNSTAGAKIRNVFSINTTRDISADRFADSGVLTTQHGFQVRESQFDISHTAGTAAGATTNAAGYAVGTKTITLAAAGVGTIVAGDVITFAGDSERYVVVTGDADVSNGGTIVIQEPGLRKAIPAVATAITVIKSGTGYNAAGVAFYRNSIVLAVRPPAVPRSGDLADMREVIVDPRSGIPYTFARYPGYGQVAYQVGIAWGYKVVQPRHTALLLG